MTDTRTPDLTAAVELARLAPSVHNTQPWLFRVTNGALELFADRDRQLQALDPEGRQLVMSCGTAVFHARLALRLQGFDADLTTGDEIYGDFLARLQPRAGAPTTPEERSLAAAATTRHTQRAPFTDKPVADDTLKAISLAVEGEGAWVRLLSGPNEQLPVIVLLGHADEIEDRDEAYREEVAEWTTRDASTHDGIPADVVPRSVRGRMSNVQGRDFALEGTPDRIADRAPVERPLVTVIGTSGDALDDWLTAGQALAHLLLAAVVDGVQASPLGQVVDLPATRAQLGRELGTIGFPQMVLRMGYAEPGPITPRRSMSEVLAG
jgi:nitroreductase